MSQETVPRRSFLTRFAAAVAAFGSASSIPALVHAAEPPADDLEAWLAGMKGTYKSFYDCVQAGGAPDGVMFARNFMKFSQEKLGTKESEMSVIVGFRHFATPFGYNDAIWAKYPQFGDMLKIEDPKTKKPAVRNIWLHDLVEGEAGANLPALRARGVQFAVCGAATEFFGRMFAGKTGDAKKIEAELIANLIPAARVVPAGVVAVQRAQKAGFTYTYAG